MTTTLPQRLQAAFDRSKIPGGVRLFVVRRDGLMVWEKQAGPQSQALAALCGGVWEAAFAMAQAAGTTSSARGFRLVFDDAQAGVLIFPIQLEGQIYYLGTVYADCMNPGRLRRQIQMLAEAVESDLTQAFTPDASGSEARAGFLFTDITDAEMDRLFGA